MNNYTWGGHRPKPKSTRVYSMDALTTIESRLAVMIKKKMGNMKRVIYCNFYDGGHPNHEFSSMGTTVEQGISSREIGKITIPAQTLINLMEVLPQLLMG